MNKLLRTTSGLRALTSAALLLVAASTALARCPEGSYPWVDRRGIEFCRQDLIGPREASLANDGGCPHVANAGPRTCAKRMQDFDGGAANAAGYPPAPRRAGQREAR